MERNMWAVQQARMTVFKSSPEHASWESFANIKPQTRQEDFLTRTITEIGLYNKGSLVLTSTIPRCDWIFFPQGQANAQLPVINAFSATDSYPAVASQFFEDGKKWVMNYPQSGISRIAVGAVLTERVSDREEGYNKLQPLLSSVKLDPANTSEFFYQINRPAPSKIFPEIRLNRLMKYSVMALQTVFSTGADVPSKTSQKTHFALPPLFAVRLEADINTPAEGLSTENWGQLLDELLAELLKMSERGEFA
jgi:hypothetical protein